MKRPSFIFLLLYCFLFFSCRKDVLHWQEVVTIPNGGNTQWNTIQWLPSGVGIIGGGGRFETAQMLISTDKGNTWQQKKMPDESKGFFGACVAPNDDVYFCGFGLNVCYSSDAMANYNFNRVAGPYEFPSAISFPENAHGIMVTSLGTDSGKILHFDNALRFISAMAYPFALHDIQMFDAQNGIAVGSGAVLKTKDGGYTWERLAIIGDNFYRIAALNKQFIVVCGIGGYIVKTTNGGLSWTRIRNGSNLALPRYSLWDICFLNEQKGYAVGEKGLVIYTDDGGEHWSEFDQFTKENLRFISVCPDGKLIVGGENGALFLLHKK